MRNELLTKSELARILKVSEGKINKDLEKGLVHTRLGRLVRFDYEKVIIWYSEQNKDS